MLILTEIGEAVNADRKGRRADAEEFNNTLKITDFGFMRTFERYIKDSVEDELADVVIRCLDFAGLKKFDLPPVIDTTINSMSFTEVMYICVLHLNQSIHRMVDKHSIMLVISTLLEESNNLGFDLLWFIERKMRYNELREPMHGKKY